MQDVETIFALASGQGKAGVAVVRLSGPGAWHAGLVLAGSLPKPRQAGLRTLRTTGGEILDQALVLCFEQSGSFTGEQVVEFHLHGATATIAAVLGALKALPGLRLAEPGEFTRRALENGCLDLAQVEGLGDLLEAETEAQRKQALKVFSGALGDVVEIWRKDLIRALALLEATIDFADEDLPVDVTPEVTELLEASLLTLHKEVAGVAVAERIRDGFEVAIIGPPNIGKSSLLNRLAGREAAITSEIAGTTRDVIELRMDMGGLPVTLLDTAGLRTTEDLVENLGIDRARLRAEAADLRIFLTKDGRIDALGIAKEKDDIIVVGKSDLGINTKGLAISSRNGQGLDQLVKTIQDILVGRSLRAATATRLRHQTAMEATIGFLNAAISLIQAENAQDELAAMEIRGALQSLDALIGRVDIEQVLDEIFSSFCLGK